MIKGTKKIKNFKDIIEIKKFKDKIVKIKESVNFSRIGKTCRFSLFLQVLAG